MQEDNNSNSTEKRIYPTQIKSTTHNNSVNPIKRTSKKSITSIIKQNNGNKEINLLKLSDIEIPVNKSFTNRNENISNNSDLLYSESKKRKKLIIEEICGNLFKDKKIEINEEGLINNSIRNKKDGITYFGSNIPSKNDYVLNMTENTFKYLPTIFKIYFNKEDDKYYIGTDNPGMISEAMLFAKIENNLIYKNKILISLGSAYFFIEVKNEKLYINFTSETGNTQSYIFTVEKEKITIGRGKQCDIVLHDICFSRIHTTIIYNKNINSWVIYDGDNNKKSTNGTWAFLNWFMSIYDNIKIRIGTSILKINIQNEE